MRPVGETLTHQLKDYAHRLGFELAGIAAPQSAPGWERFSNWLDRGFAGEMNYLRHGAEARADPQRILPGVRSIVVLGMSYHQPEARTRETPAAHGRVATFALGLDYHEVLWRKLDQLGEWLHERSEGSVSRGVVDTAPLLEREYARLAGLGWFGKNTMLIHKGMGSFFFIASLLTTVELEPDPPYLADHCGTCTACLDACPTQAFPEPGVLDAQKCISYLTIEVKRVVPGELRTGIGEWVFGCDVCQDVCPWNRRPPAGQTASSREPWLDLLELLALTPEEFRRRFKGTALWRSRRRGLLRNSAIVLGNRGDPRAVPALLRALGDEEQVVRGAAAWALGRFLSAGVEAALRERSAMETDATVLEEIRQALGELPPCGTRTIASASQRIEPIEPLGSIG